MRTYVRIYILHILRALIILNLFFSNPIYANNLDDSEIVYPLHIRLSQFQSWEYLDSYNQTSSQFVFSFTSEIWNPNNGTLLFDSFQSNSPELNINASFQNQDLELAVLDQYQGGFIAKSIDPGVTNIENQKLIIEIINHTDHLLPLGNYNFSAVFIAYNTIVEIIFYNSYLNVSPTNISTTYDPIPNDWGKLYNVHNTNSSQDSNNSSEYLIFGFQIFQLLISFIIVISLKIKIKKR